MEALWWVGVVLGWLGAAGLRKVGRRRAAGTVFLELRIRGGWWPEGDGGAGSAAGRQRRGGGRGEEEEE